jgi:hypothetical protein
MADYDRIMQALRAADQAGDTEGATRLAQMAREAQAPTDESYAKRAVKAIPGAFEGVARTVGNIAGAIPQGIRMAGEAIFSDASLEDSIARSESSNWMNYVPSSQTGRDTEEMLGKAMQVPVDMLAEGASVTGQEVGNILGAGEDWKNNFDAGIKSTTEGVSNILLPIPGLKGVGKVASKIAGTEGRVRQDLLRELDAQKTSHGTDPLTAGAQPNVAPWTPTKPGTQLPLDLGQIGAEAPPGLYEAGMHPDTYLKNEDNPQPGQGDLFAGTKPYTPEQLPEQAARGRAAVAQAEAIAKAMEFKAPELMDPAGPEIGAPKPQLEMPGIEPPNPGLESGISFKGNAEPGVRGRLDNPLDSALDIESGRSGKTFSNDPHAVEYPTRPGQQWMWPDNAKGPTPPTPFFDPNDATSRGTFPQGTDGTVAPAHPFEGKQKEPLRGNEPFRGDHESGRLTPKTPNEKAATPAYSALDAFLKDLLSGKEQFPTADGSGIVKMGNGGYIDWKATANGLRTLVQAGGRMIKVVGRHMDLNEGPHGVMRLSLLDDKDGKRIGEIDLSPKQRFDPVDGKNNPLVANVHLSEGYRGKGIVSDMYKWIAANLGDMVQNKGSTREGGQKLWASLERNGVAKDGRISVEKTPDINSVLNFEKPPKYGDPMTLERKLFLAWEGNKTIKEFEQKLKAILERNVGDDQVRWDKEWQADTRVRSISQAKAELDLLKEKQATRLEGLQKEKSPYDNPIIKLGNGAFLETDKFPQALRALKQKLASRKGVLKDKNGDAVVVFRGQHSSEHDQRTSRDNYATFTTDNPHLAGAYAGSVVTPFTLHPKKIIEFKLTPREERLGSGPAMFRFDDMARKLGKGEVLVWRNMQDNGPYSGWDFDKNKHAYGQGLEKLPPSTMPSDQYAFKDPNVAEHAWGLEDQNKNPYDNDGPIYMANGGFISPEFQKKAFEFVKTSIMGKAKNTINGMTEQARLMSMDHRTAAEVVNSLDPKTIEDFGGVARAFSNATDQSGMARIARDYKGSGTLINWLNDRIKYIDRKYGTIKEDLLKGTEYVKSLRGFEFRTTSDKSPVKLFQDQIKKDWEGSREMLKEWFNASRDGREPSFKNPEHQVVYDAWQKVFDYSRIHMNALRVKAGLEPIGKQTAYFPLMRMGDWRVVAEDANGNPVGAWHLPNRVAAWQFKKLLAKDSPDLKVGDVHHLKQSKYDYKNSDFTALEAANAALKSQPDVLAAVTKAYAEAMGHKGFGGKHAVQSEHVLGAMGLDYSRKGVVDALKAFEMYTERSMDYIAGLEKKQAMADLVAEIGKKPELQGKIENTLAHMTDMFELSRDSLKDELSGVTKTLDWVARTSMLGEKGAASVMRDMNGLVSSWLLSTASFALSQIVQPATGLAGLTIAEGGGIKGFGLAGVDTFKGLYKTFFPDQLGREGVSWAAKKGYITPEVAELYGSRHISAHDSMAREVLSHPVKSYLRGFSFISQALEKQAVRIPYFLMQLEALKGQITDKNMLFETAAQATDKYMVDYARQNQAMLWQRMGAIGTGVKPLKQFSNNFLGQFAEFASEAKHGDLVPMAVMLGTSIMLAGLAGNIVVQTADDMIRGINAISNANIPTIHEKVMEMDKDNKLNKNVKSVAQFGVGSSILGYDVSSSVAQNSVKSMFTIPVGEVPFKITKDLGTYLFKDWKGKATEADMMKAYLAITPPSLKEYMRNQFVVNGAVPNASRNMMLEYQRGPEEMKANEGFFGMQNLLSRPSLNEAQARAINRAAAENLREQALDKKSSAAVLADNLISGKPITPEMLQNYIKEGGDPRNLPTLVRNRIMGKTFTEIDQQQMKKGISGVAAREAIKDETKAQSNLQKQSWGDHTKREDPIPEEVRGTDLKWKGPRGTGKNYQPMGRTDYDPMPPMGQPQQRVLDDLAPALKVPGNPTIPRVPYVDPKSRLERLRAMQGVM